MEQKYMQHQKHGVMPVYNELEVKANAKNGWALIALDEIRKRISAKTAVPEQAPEEKVIVEKVVTRRGRPPKNTVI
jgi:hypothetical protein